LSVVPSCIDLIQPQSLLSLKRLFLLPDILDGAKLTF